MKIDNTCYTIVDQFDISGIIQEISSMPKETWDIDSSRQQAYHQHRKTKNIFVNDVDNRWNGFGYPLVKYSVNENLSNYANVIANKLETIFGGKVGKTLYINLPAGESIDRHCDRGYYLTNVHRFHIPIITNERVDFELADVTINMKAGICYEIDNTRLHSVVNRGESDRVHLMIDIIPMNVFR